MPETSPSPNSNDQFLPASPLTKKDILDPGAKSDKLADVIDINKKTNVNADDKESRGRKPDGPPRSLVDVRQRNADIGDLVKIGSSGRGHQPRQTDVSGNKYGGGKFISEDNMDVIAANADYIRDNLPSGETTPEEPTPEEPTPGETTPEEPTPEEPTPEEPTPEEPTPEEPTPEEPTPEEPTPEEPTPEEPTPEEPTPEEPTPEEPTPEEPTPEEPTPEPPVPEGPYPPFDLYPPEDEDGPETPPEAPAPGETPPEAPAPGETPPEEPTPEEPTPETPDGPDGPDGPESRGNRAVRNLDDSIVAFARARIALERILGGKNQEAYDVAEANLHLAYNEYIANLSEEVAEGNRELNTRVEALDASIDSISDQISATEDAIASAAPDADIAQMYANIAAHEARQQELEGRRSELQSQIEASEVRNNEIIAQRVAEVSTRVDSEMLAQRERAHPRLTKINEWLRTHTKTRIVVGVALAASGFVGVVTGNVPLVVGSIAARAALSGYGGYNAARGFGERRADKRFNAADTSSIEDYTAAAGNQSRTRRRSKKTGAVIGGAMAAVPIIRGIANAGDVVTTPKPQAPVPETPIPAPPSNIPNLTPTDFRFPWTHMTDQIGSNGTPRIMEIANNAPKLGWQVIGNGQGGGSGAILRIIDPVGKVYEGNGPINAALDYLGTQTP